MRIAGTLALAGHEVRVLGNTATVRPSRVSAYRLLEQAGFAPRILPAKSGGRLRPELHYRHGAVDCRVIDSGPGGLDDRLFNWVLDQELRDFQPDIVVVPEGTALEMKRHARAKTKGAKLVLSVAGIKSLHAGEQLSIYDAAICQSQWLAETWAASAPLKPVALPPPVPREEVIADRREPVCVAFPSPTRDNGLFLLLRLAEQLSLADADLPHPRPDFGGCGGRPAMDCSTQAARRDSIWASMRTSSWPIPRLN